MKIQENAKSEPATRAPHSDTVSLLQWLQERPLERANQFHRVSLLQGHSILTISLPFYYDTTT